MFFLFPLGHEQMEARRWPLVTLAIIALCALLLGWQMLAEHQIEVERRALSAEATRLIGENPGTEVPGALRGLLELRGPATERVEELAPAPPELMALAARAEALSESSPSRRFGFRRQGAWWAIVSYAFLHGGLLHFAGNAWFLWLSGATIEDRWGRSIYAGFYLAAAVIAALTHRLLTGHPEVALIGASGAVAGAMGAFMIVHGKAKIRFAYMLFISLKPRVGTFEAKAYVMLLLWLASETFWALLGLGDGTAHFAHLGGFAFGAALAFGFKRSGFDHRLDAAIDQETSRWQDGRVLEAGKLAADQRYDEAFTLLDQAARDLPHSIDVQLEMLRLAQESRERPRELSAYQRLIENYLQQNMPDAALTLLGELGQRGLELERGARFRIGEVLARSGQRDAARELYHGLLADGVSDELAIRAAIAFATLSARSARAEEARQHLELARKSPHRTAELAQRIDAQLAALDAKGT